MEYYSHRGNLCGSESQRENAPDFIDAAIARGLKVECDVRAIDNRFWLGHDVPRYPVLREWLMDRESKLLMHCKDMNSARLLGERFHCLGHVGDPFTVTTRGAIWLHFLAMPPNLSCIVPLISDEQVREYHYRDMRGVCSDWPLLCREKFA